MWRFRLIELRSSMEAKLKRRVLNHELATAAGVSVPTIGRWLADPVVSVKSEHVRALADYFDVPWHEVIEPVAKGQRP